MGKFFYLWAVLWLLSGQSLMAASCNCEVKVYHPTTVSQKLKAATMKEYQLENFDTLSIKNQYQCRSLCLKEFHRDLPAERLAALLITLSQRLIDEGVAGYNCTGLTTFKYPLRVKAKLGRLAIGNVADQIEVVTHEQACF